MDLNSTSNMRDVVVAIHPYLETLLGDQAQVVEKELDELLKQTVNEELLQIHILRILHRADSTRRWLEEYFQARQIPGQEGTKSYDPPIPVIPTPPPFPKYSCPHPDHQDYIDFQYSIGQKMQCPVHHIALVLVVDNSGGNHAHQTDGGTRR